MDNPVTSLSSKGAFVISACLLAGGSLMFAAALLGLVGSYVPGTVIMLLAAVASTAVLALISLKDNELELERKSAIRLAESLSLGQTTDIDADDPLLGSLRSVSDYLRDKSVAIDRLSNGDLNGKDLCRSDSDLLGRSLTGLLPALRSSVDAADARDRLHDSVVKLLDEVAGASAGDLTITANVGPEVTGPIADAFNSVTENLRGLIRQIQKITEQMGTSSGSINEATEQLARGSVVQASQLARTTSAITKMATQIQEVSENAERSSKVASDSLTKARSGTKAAEDNINAMRCVRKRVQDTSKRVKRLGERSQEIAQIVALIEDLSDRTSLLALNASLQASAAGPAGAAFGPVAEEVERLAERSNRLSRQISSLTLTINNEIREVVSAMEDTIHEVVIGSTLADKAGNALFSIETISVELAVLLKSISDSAKYQAKSSEDISNAMTSISEVTELVENASRRAADSVRSLIRLSDELQTSVSPFKLPVSVATAINEQPSNGHFVH